MTKYNALASYLNISIGEMAGNEGSNEFDTSEGTYLVLTEYEQQEALRTEISDSVWAFNPDFLSDQTNLDPSVFIALQPNCEGSNEAILHLIESTCGLNSFIKKAVQYDGAGHFLSPYDGEELELPSNLFAYRRD